MDRTKRIVGALLACAILGGCQGGSGGSSTSNPNQTTSQTPPGGSGSPSAFGPSTSTQTTLLLIPSGTHSLGIYLRNPWTGALVDRGYVQTGQTPGAIAVSGGQYVYVANSASGTISAYGWQSATNKLVSLGPAVTGGAGGLSSLAVVGGFLYAVNTNNNTIAIFAIGSNGQITAASATNTPALTSAVAGANGTLYGLEANGLVPYSVSANGTLTQGPVTTVTNTIVGAATDAAGNLYAVTTTSVHAYAPSGSGLTALGSAALPSGFTPTGITVAANTVAVAGNTSSGTEVVYYPITGGEIAASPTDPVTGTGTAAGISASPNGRYVFVTNATRDDVFAYTTPTASGTSSVLNSALRTRVPPRAPVSLAVTVTLQAQTLYVVDQSTTSIAAYPAATNGALGTPALATTCNSCSNPADMGPSAAAIGSTGQHLYASDWAQAGQGDITTFGMLAPNGALGTPSSIPAGLSPMGVAVDPSDRYLYVANSCYTNGGGNCPGTIDGYNLNQGVPSAFTSGFSTDVSGAYPMLLAIDPTGRFLYSSEFAGSLVDAFAIDPNHGTLTLAGTAPTSTNPWTIVVGPAGRHLYVSDNGNGGSQTAGAVSLFTINATNGTLTPNAGQSDLATTALKPLGLAIGPKGRRLYVATQNGALDVFTRTEPLSAGGQWSWTPTVITGNFNNAYGLAISANGEALYVLDNCTGSSSTNGSIQALAIPAFSNPLTGAGYKLIGQYPTGACSVQAIPAGGLN